MNVNGNLWTIMLGRTIGPVTNRVMALSTFGYVLATSQQAVTSFRSSLSLKTSVALAKSNVGTSASLAAIRRCLSCHHRENSGTYGPDLIPNRIRTISLKDYVSLLLNCFLGYGGLPRPSQQYQRCYLTLGECSRVACLPPL